MNLPIAKSFATVIFAMYDDTPIACQGDDDHRKIQVIRERLRNGAELQADALRKSFELGALHGLPVQVWDVQVDS